MSRLSRRAVLAAPAAAALPPVAAIAAPPADAELIQWCSAYVDAVRYVNTADFPNDAAMNAAIDARIAPAEAAIDAHPPRTMAGVLAKARMAQAVAGMEPAGERWHGGAAGNFAVDVVRDLLRLHPEA